MASYPAEYYIKKSAWNTRGKRAHVGADHNLYLADLTPSMDISRAAPIKKMHHIRRWQDFLPMRLHDAEGRDICW